MKNIETKKCVGPCGLEKEITLFPASGNKCKFCCSEYKKGWYQKNKKEILEDRKEHYKENKEKIDKNNKEYAENHKEEIKEYQKKYREENKEQIAKNKKEYAEEHKEEVAKNHNEYYLENKEKLNKINKKYNEEHKEEIIEYKKEWYQKNKEELIIYQKEYKKENKEQILKYQQEYKKNRRKQDPSFKIREILSREINRLIKNNGSSKNGISCLSSLGKNHPQKIHFHIESQFSYWMTWENHGPYNAKTWDDNDPRTWRWNIDHIIPHAFFKYTSPNDIECLMAWSLSNLRPLSAKQNIIDGYRPTDTELHKTTMAKILEELAIKRDINI